MSNKVSDAAASQMKDLLIRVIEDKQSSKDAAIYETLRMTLIRELDAVDIPDFLFGIETLDEFKKFINLISLTEYGRKDYVSNIFNQLSKNTSNSKVLTSIIDRALVESKQNSKISEETNQGASVKIVKYAWYFISLIATFATIYGVYLQVKSTGPKVTVSNFSVSHLTIPPKVVGLKASYYYRDSAVTDLWKLDVLVKNTGEETLLTVGPKKNIISNEGIVLHIGKRFKLLDINQVSSTFPVKIHEKNDTTLLLNFEQWRRNEEIKIEMYLENTIPSISHNPFASISERQMIDGKSENISYNTNVSPKKTLLADYLPRFVSAPLKWFVSIIYGITGLIAFPAVVISEVRGKKTKEEKRNSILGGVFLSLLFTLPLLWLIPKFW